MNLSFFVSGLRNTTDGRTGQKVLSLERPSFMQDLPRSTALGHGLQAAQRNRGNHFNFSKIEILTLHDKRIRVVVQTTEWVAAKGDHLQLKWILQYLPCGSYIHNG